jgi:hypothetical protein
MVLKRTNISGDGFDRRFKTASILRLDILIDITDVALSPPFTKKDDSNIVIRMECS